MAKAHHRKKAPEQVRRAILDCVARMAADQGLANLSIQAVASAAGVTKGGLFHHFPNKQALVEAACADLMQSLDDLVDRHLARMTGDDKGYGSFTRAYVETLLSPAGNDNLWASLSIALVADPQLRGLWLTWLEARLEKHRDTDADPALEIVRYAADGVWLANVMRNGDSTLSALPAQRTQLLALIKRKTP